jgi:hypothetical protein
MPTEPIQGQEQKEAIAYGFQLDPSKFKGFLVEK